MELYILVGQYIVAGENNVNVSAFFGRHLFSRFAGRERMGKG